MKTKSVRILLRFACTIFIIVISYNSIQCQNLTFEQHPIDMNFNGIMTIQIIDLDNDSDLDIIGGSEITPTTASKGLAWWRNNGNNNWERFIIDASFIHIMSVDVADINNDGFPDIVATSWQLNQVAWWENSGDPTQSWTRYIINSNFTNAHDVKCTDIDSDGDTDIVAASYGLGRIDIFYNDGNPTSNWQSSTLPGSFNGALGVFVIDLDKDDDPDILGTAADAGLISWWENSGSNPINWAYHNIASNFTGSSSLYVVDMNYDGLYDIVSHSWSSNQVAYWLCNNLSSNSWIKHVVSTQLLLAAGVCAADLDQDNNVDIVGVGKDPGELVIYENDNFTFSELPLTNDFYGGEDVKIIDLDKDDDLDIVAAASSGKLVWWENQTPVGIFDENSNRVPQKFSLGQNYPNPFNPTTKITYSIPKISFVSLKVYGVLGNEIATLVNEEKQAGEHEINFNAVDLPSGVYIYSLTVGEMIKSQKMLIIK